MASSSRHDTCDASSPDVDAALQGAGIVHQFPCTPPMSDDDWPMRPMPSRENSGFASSTATRTPSGAASIRRLPAKELESSGGCGPATSRAPPRLCGSRDDGEDASASSDCDEEPWVADKTESEHVRSRHQTRRRSFGALGSLPLTATMQHQLESSDDETTAKELQTRNPLRKRPVKRRCRSSHAPKSVASASDSWLRSPPELTRTLQADDDSVLVTPQRPIQKSSLNPNDTYEEERIHWTASELREFRHEAISDAVKAGFDDLDLAHPHWIHVRVMTCNQATLVNTEKNRYLAHSFEVNIPAVVRGQRGRGRSSFRTVVSVRGRDARTASRGRSSSTGRATQARTRTPTSLLQHRRPQTAPENVVAPRSPLASNVEHSLELRSARQASRHRRSLSADARHSVSASPPSLHRDGLLRRRLSLKHPSLSSSGSHTSADDINDGAQILSNQQRSVFTPSSVSLASSSADSSACISAGISRSRSISIDVPQSRPESPPFDDSPVAVLAAVDSVPFSPRPERRSATDVVARLADPPAVDRQDSGLVLVDGEHKQPTGLPGHVAAASEPKAQAAAKACTIIVTDEGCGSQQGATVVDQNDARAKPQNRHLITRHQSSNFDTSDDRDVSSDWAAGARSTEVVNAARAIIMRRRRSLGHRRSRPNSWSESGFESLNSASTSPRSSPPPGEVLGASDGNCDVGLKQVWFAPEIVYRDLHKVLKGLVAAENLLGKAHRYYRVLEAKAQMLQFEVQRSTNRKVAVDRLKRRPLRRRHSEPFVSATNDVTGSDSFAPLPTAHDDAC